MTSYQNMVRNRERRIGRTSYRQLMRIPPPAEGEYITITLVIKHPRHECRSKDCDYCQQARCVSSAIDEVYRHVSAFRGFDIREIYGTPEEHVRTMGAAQ